MDIDKIIDGLSGKRKQACELVRKNFDMSGSRNVFWGLVSRQRWAEAADYLYGLNKTKEAEIAADMLWEG